MLCASVRMVGAPGGMAEVQTPRSVRLVLTLASLGRDGQHNCQPTDTDL